MKKLLLSVLLAATAAGAYAQDAITGYFRVQSAESGNYVEVRGPFTTAPDCTYENALANAGTVMRLRAFPDYTADGELRYKVGNLSCQGIEVFGSPRTDYLEAIVELTQFINSSNYSGAAYALQRKAREMGYIASGRAIVAALFEVVASRLEDEIKQLPAETQERLGIASRTEKLADFARRFNEEVTAKIDLHAYLEPGDAPGAYRLYFNWIDCTPVSEFYLDENHPENKQSFEIGFECMRQYMSGKSGLGSGEGFDEKEIALWKSWGYDFVAKHPDAVKNEDGLYIVKYEQIFTEHELLYNWLKMYIERFIDPEKAPDAQILGINFKDFAAEMQRHAIMQGFLKYIPSIQEGQKLYLANGRFADGINEFSTVGTVSDGSDRFGLLAQEQADANIEATTWNVIPVDHNTDNYFAIAPVGHRVNKPNETNGHLMAMFLDFPVKEPEGQDNMTLYNTDNALKFVDLKNMGGVEYIDLSADAATMRTQRQKSFLVECKTDEIADNKVEIVWESQAGDYDPETAEKPETRPGGFIVSDDYVDIQHIQSRADSETISGGTPTGETALSHGVLLATPASAEALSNIWGIDLKEGNKVYDLSTRSSVLADGTTPIHTPWFMEATQIPANHAFLQAAEGKHWQAISLGEPIDEFHTITGITDAEMPVKFEDNVLYDLSGRRVTAPVSGTIYILNGKKVLLRK